MLILGTLYCIILSFGYIFALSNSQSFIKQSNNQTIKQSKNEQPSNINFIYRDGFTFDKSGGSPSEYYI